MKIYRLALAGALALTVLFPGGILRADHSGNLLQNPGFEEGTAGWATNAGSLSSVESPVESGARAVALNSASINTIWVCQMLSIEGAGSYTFSGYALKNDPNVAKVMLRISWYDRLGVEISRSDSLVALTDDQPRYRLLTTGEVTAPVNSCSARVKAVVTPRAATSATVYFDNFSLLGPAPSPSPAPTATPSPIPTSMPTLEPTPSPTPTTTLIPTRTPSPTLTPSPTPRATPTSTQWPILTATPEPSLTPMLSPTSGPTTAPTVTRTPAPSPSPAATQTATPSRTVRPTPRRTPTPTPTPALVATPTPTPAPSDTFTPTPNLTPAATPAATATNTPGPANEGDILINEVQYDASQTGIDTAYEWIELLNCTEQTIFLNGWNITDNQHTDPVPDLTLPAGGFAVVAATTDVCTNFPDFTGTIVFIADGSIGNGLSNTGDRLSLQDSTGKIIDALSYGEDDTIMLPPCQDVPPGHSAERRPAGLDTNQASDFVDNAAPSPGHGLSSAPQIPTPSSTPEVTATPCNTTTSTPIATPIPPTVKPSPTVTAAPTTALTPSPFPIPTVTTGSSQANEGDILINEIQYNPPQTGAESAFEWIELFNNTGHTIDVTSWSISDNSESDPVPSLALPPNSFAVIASSTDFYINFPDFSGNIVFMADGSLGNGLSNTGDRLIVLDSAGRMIDASSYGDDSTAMSPPCHSVSEGHSLERQPAGLDTNQASDFVDNATPSPGYGQTSAAPASTPVPTSSFVPTPTMTRLLPTPAAAGMTPSPYFTPDSKPAPSQTASLSSNRDSSWILTKTPVFLFVIGLALLATVVWLKRPD